MSSMRRNDEDDTEEDSEDSEYQNQKFDVKFFRGKRMLVGMIFAACDGFVNGSTLKRFGTFGGAMTGNTVKLGLQMGNGNWWPHEGDDVPTAALFAVTLVAFFLGSLLAWSLHSKRKKGSYRYLSFLVLALFVLAEILCFNLLAGSPWEKWCTVTIPFAMGIVDVVNFSGWLGYHVSFMTGNMQRMANTFWIVFSNGGCWTRTFANRARAQEVAEANRTYFVILSIWIFYVVGGFLGAKCTNDHGPEGPGKWAIIYPGIIISLMIFWLEDPKNVADDTPRGQSPLFRLFDRGDKGHVDIDDVRNIFREQGLRFTEEDAEQFLHYATEDGDTTMRGSAFVKWITAHSP